MTLFVGFLVLAVGAVVTTGWRERVTVAANGGRLPAASRYQPGPAIAVAWIEALRLVRHPFVLLGIVSVPLAIWLDPQPHPRGVLAGPYFGLLIGLFVAVHLSLGRDRHTGMDELVGTLPTGRRSRTASHLFASIGLATVLGLSSIVVVLVRLGPDRSLPGVHPATPWTTTATWSPQVLELVQPLTALVLIVVLAVATGRWWRHPAAAVLAAVVILISPFTWVLDPYHFAGPQVHHATGAPTGVIATAHLAWHTLFLAGLLAVGAGLALYRDDRRARIVMLTLIGIAAAITGQALKGL